jgi:hypothetical protein
MSVHERPSAGRLRAFVLKASVAVGLIWLSCSAHRALQSADDSDVVRQWKVAQYVHRGIDPYRVSAEILRRNFGSMHGPDRMRLRKVKLYEVHRTMNTEGVDGFLPEVGPPTATYPPSSALLFAYTFGFVPKAWLHEVWLLVNLAALAALVAVYRTFPGRGDGGAPAPWLAASCLLLLWPPTQEVFLASQFVFLVLIFALTAIRLLPARPAWSGVFFALALLKPSVALPFLIIPFVRGRWMLLAAVAGVHAAATLALSAIVHAPATAMLSAWMEIPRYMLQGAYTLQEALNALELENTAEGTALTLGFVGACTAWCAAFRRAPPLALAGLLAFTSMLWTYHERYDFVVLLIPIAPAWFALAEGRRPLPRPALATLVLYAVLGLALTDAAYAIDHPAARAARWAGRAAMAALFVRTLLDVRASHRAAHAVH